MKESLAIENKESWYKNKKFLTSLMAIFIISVMVLSVVTLDSSSEEKVSYNDLTFFYTEQGVWQAYLPDGKRITLQTDPRDLTDVSVPSLDFSSLSSLQKVYVSINPYDPIEAAVFDIQANLPLPIQTDVACYEDNDLCTTLPLKTCADASLTTGIILLKEANDTVVRFESNCWMIEGKDLLTLTDKLILEYYG